MDRIASLLPDEKSWLDRNKIAKVVESLHDAPPEVKQEFCRQYRDHIAALMPGHIGADRAAVNTVLAEVVSKLRANPSRGKWESAIEGLANRYDGKVHTPTAHWPAGHMPQHNRPHK